MGTPTYTAIASQTLTSSASSVTFSSIPQDYRDLVLVIDGQLTLSGIQGLQFNSDSGSNYSYVQMFGDGSSTGSASGTSQTYSRIGFDGTNKFVNLTQIMDFSATDKHKSLLSRGDSAAFSTRAIASRWANTAAITSMTVVTSTGLYTAGSTFSLYGIAA